MQLTFKILTISSHTC